MDEIADLQTKPVAQPNSALTRGADTEFPSGAAATTLVMRIYSQLRRDILDGTLRPNQLLVEADIALRMGVSRMPVRESLQRLMADGLVESRKRRWIVHEFTH